MIPLPTCPDKDVACAGKHGYASAALAKEVCSRSARKKHKSAEVYKCIHCRLWHIGHVLRNRRHKERSLKTWIR